MSHKIIILTRTYFKDGDILMKNLCSTLNIFVNRDKYKFGIILDDETIKDHTLGELLLNENPCLINITNLSFVGGTRLVRLNSFRKVKAYITLLNLLMKMKKSSISSKYIHHNFC